MSRVVVALAVVTLVGCGTATGEATADDRPMPGTARDAVECRTDGSDGVFRGEVYDEGATARSADGAVETALSEGVGIAGLDELRVAASTADRRLYVSEVDSRVVAALVVRDGPGSEGAGGDGWYVESWAQCDLVELPAAYVESLGYQVWTDTEGVAVPTTELEVYRGPEHCSWQSMTFFHLVGEQGTTFLRDPIPEFRRYVEGPFDPHTVLPDDAVDSGYRHEGDTMWWAPDRSRAWVGATPEDVELWPRMTESVGCA